MFKSKQRYYTYVSAIEEAENHKKYINHYIDNDEKNVVFEMGNKSKEALENNCVIYNIRTNTWEESEFITEEDFDQIEYELAHKTFREKREDKINEDRIIINCSNYIHGLSISGIQYMEEYFTPSKNMKLLLRELKLWDKDFKKFNYWNKTSFEEKVFKKSIRYKRWINEGKRIFNKAKRISKPGDKILFEGLNVL